MRHSHPPCVPYFGLYFNDFLYIEEGNPDTLGDGLVNFHKRRLFSEIISTIQAYQSTTYELQEIPELSERLRNLRIEFQEDDVSAGAASSSSSSSLHPGTQSPRSKMHRRMGSNMVALSFLTELHQEKSQDKDMKDVLNKLSHKHEPRSREKSKSSSIFPSILTKRASNK